MQFSMLTKVSEEGASHFDALSEAERAAGIEAHLAWFTRHAASINGGYELAFPPEKTVMTAAGVTTTTDGPFAETKELIGGVIILEAETLEGATAIATDWPSLSLYPGAAVEVVAVAVAD